MKLKSTLISSFGICLLFLTGCSRTHMQDQAYRIHDDGREKAQVCVTEIYDPLNIQIPWSLAEDLTSQVKARLVKKGYVFLTNLSVEEIDMQEEASQEQKLGLEENLTLNLNFEKLKEKYPDSEFVVLMELAKHQARPKNETGKFMDKITPSYLLEMGVRVRIVDFRQKVPQIILHEIIEQSHLMPKQFASINVDNPMWGKKTYSISPIGFAHSSLVKEISERIERYLIIAKTH